MILEQFGVADITPQRVQRLVAGDFHELEQVGATPGCRCDEPGPQRMAGEASRIQAVLEIRERVVDHVFAAGTNSERQFAQAQIIPT